MNLLIYSTLNLAFGGGFERWIKEVTPKFVERGHRVFVVTTKAGDVKDPIIRDYLIKKKVAITELDNYDRPLTIPKLEELCKFVSLIKSACDIIYFNNAFAGNEILMLYIKRVTGIKIIAGYHGIFPQVGGHLRRLYYRTINKEVSRSFDAHHVVNSDREKLLLSYRYKNVSLIPNGVDVSKLKPAQKRERFTVLFVGRLNYQKGFDIFVRIVKYLTKYCEKDIEFVIVGEGSLRYLAEGLSRYDNVKWLGYVTDNALVEAYQKAHVLVAPSIYYL